MVDTVCVLLVRYLFYEKPTRYMYGGLAHSPARADDQYYMIGSTF